MTVYAPDNWVVIKFKGDKPHYKVLAGWSGGYLSADSWRLNSGITKARLEGNVFVFEGSSGSSYNCHKDSYAIRGNTIGTWNALVDKFNDKVELIDEHEDWLTMDWLIN